MAGTGLKFRRRFPRGTRRTLTAAVSGFACNAAPVAAPALLEIAGLPLAQRVTGGAGQELFVRTAQTVFVFSLLAVSPFRPVLSACLSDAVYEKRLDDLLPAYYAGLLTSLSFAAAPGIPFCLFLAGSGIPAPYVFAGYGGYMLLNIVLLTMTCLLNCNDDAHVSGIFLFGTLAGTALSVFSAHLPAPDAPFAALLSLDAAFFLIAVLEYTAFRRYCTGNSGQYLAFFFHFPKCWKFQAANFFYTLGACAHHLILFILRSGNQRTAVSGGFIPLRSYDMASCLALLTNLSASVILFARIRLRFEPYSRAFFEAVAAARGADLDRAAARMFRQIYRELKNLVCVQLCITLPVCLAVTAALPLLGFDGPFFCVYPSLCVGYLLLFLSGAAMDFLCRLADADGALLTAAGLFCGAFPLSAVLTRLPEIWHGMGLVTGALTACILAYARLRWLERRLPARLFCGGEILGRGRGQRPSARVFDRGRKGADISAHARSEAKAERDCKPERKKM